MADSSYVKIAKQFLTLPAWKALVARYRESLAKVPPEVGVEFSYGSVWDSAAGRSTVGPVATFWATVPIPGRGGDPLRFGSTNPSVVGFTLNGTDVEPLKKIFADHFGVRVDPRWKRLWVPTYNCNESKARDEFLSRGRDDIEEALSAEAQACKEKILTAWSRFDPAMVEAGKEEAFHRAAVTQIRDSVLKWHDRVPARVIREALDQVVTHAVLED